MGRLTDEQYLQFLTDGYIVVQPSDMTDEDHDELYQCGAELWQRAGNLKSPTVHLEVLGDNLRSSVPATDRLLSDTQVVDSIKSVLGEEYILHPHNFVHRSSDVDQVFHQDGNLPWNERGHYRSHRPDWLIMFYYPQAVDDTNGPTEVVPGSQYWTKNFETENGWHPSDPFDRDFNDEVMNSDDLAYRDQRLQAALDSVDIPDLERRFVHVPKGAVVLASYDIFHRGTRKLPESPDRFMYKFFFARTTEPERPAWSNKQELNLQDVRAEIQPVVQQIWNWSRGQVTAIPIHDSDAVVKKLTEGREHEKVEAAYELGNSDSDFAADALINGIHSQSESTRRASAYGLRTLGKRVTHRVVDALTAGQPGTRRVAAYALGTVESSLSNEAIQALLDCICDDSDDLARSNAAYSLGQIARHSGCEADFLAETLISRLAPGVEPDNTSMAGLSRSTVRQSIGYALMQLAINHPLNEQNQENLTALAVNDSDRYIRGMLLEALIQILDKDPVAQHLAQGLARQRWHVPPQIQEKVPLI